MKSIFRFLFFLILFVPVQSFAQEKIGIVLSGGGASGLAHIGVLKALEERNIPIDYITGTSSGALVGALYACGYSPSEIEAFILTDSFLMMSKGELEKKQHFAYRENDRTSSMVTLPFSADSILTKSLPTHLTSSTYLDFEMMRLMEPVAAQVNYNFDSLFVPFRCLASDITNKKQVIFSEGHLNQAVRSSMTFPFYLTPLLVNHLMLFDGGLYNNFPADVMYNDFYPDYMIGSNVSYNADPPSEDDLISQVTNMLVSYSDFSLPCEQGFIIEPKIDIATFGFENAEEAIRQGYITTLHHLDSLQEFIPRRENRETVQLKRAAFKAKTHKIYISEVQINSNRKSNNYFASKSLIRTKKNEILDFNTFERRYYRLAAAKQIQFLYPLLDQKSDSTFRLNLEVRKAKDFELEIGGLFSSRSINTGYLGLSYRLLGKTASTISANSYFGKFYGSVKTEFKVDLPSTFPTTIGTYFVMNRWDYFKSFSTFFEEVKPSFLVQNEIYTGAYYKIPIANNSTSIIDARYFFLEDDYYQTDAFTNIDTVDLTKFQGATFSWEVKQNSLNRKQFATGGHLAELKFRYVVGAERTIPGSTSLDDIIKTKDHSWINISGNFQSFLLDHKNFHVGIQANATFNSQSLFSNYTASILSMTAYAPIPDMNTYFLEEYRSPQFAGVGINLILTVFKHVDLRFDGFYYQPFIMIEKNEDGSFGYSKLFAGSSWLASSSLIYHSFLGPIRLTANYFPQQDRPINLQFSFGYTLFNQRAIR